MTNLEFDLQGNQKRIIDSFKGENDVYSNFSEAMVEFEGVVYPTVEHAYQAAKTLSEKERIEIATASTPGKAKKLGRKATLRPDWEDIKLDVMLDLLRQKFHVPDRADKLLSTGDALLVEGNWWGDTFWGVCNGVGENHLGKLLMQVRQELRDERC